MLLTRGEAGDTLVEVVFAIAIISVTLVAATSIANNTYRIGIQARERVEAINLAQQQAERLRMARDQNAEAGMASILPDQSPVFCMAANLSIVGGSCTNGRYTTSITSAWAGPPIPGTGRAGRLYSINVQWQSTGSGTDRTTISTTLVDRRIEKSLINCNEETERCS